MKNTEVVPDPFNGQEPSFAEFSKFRQTGEVSARFTAAQEQEEVDQDPSNTSSPPERSTIGGDYTMPRDSGGRFTKVLSNWKEESEYLGAVLAGTVPPSEEMDADTWAAARNAERARGIKITMPQAGSSRPGNSEGAESEGEDKQAAPQSAPFLPPDHPHIERVKAAEAWYPDFPAVYEAAANIPISPLMAKALAELPNSADVAYSLAKNPYLLEGLHTLSPQRAAVELQKISNLVAYGDANGPAKPARQTSAPAPPEPVGARATARAFDVNDESGTADDWAKKRWEQVHGKRK